MSGAPGAALLAGGLALAAALFLAPGAARADDECGAATTNPATVTCVGTTDHSGGIVYNNQPRSITLNVQGYVASDHQVLTTGSDGTRDSGIFVSTATHASNAYNLQLNAGSNGQIDIVQGTTTQANGADNNRGILLRQQSGNGATTTLVVPSWVTIGSATTKMKAEGILLDFHATGAASAGAVSVTVRPTIHSVGSGVAVANYPGTGTVTVNALNRLSITTEQHGISVSHSGSAGDVDVTFRGVITSASTVSHRGIEAVSTGKDSAGDDHDVSVTMVRTDSDHPTPSISVLSGGVGIYAAVGAARQEANTGHADYVAPMNAGLAKVDVDHGSITAKAGAIQAFNYEAGSVQVDVASGVTLTSTQGHGIEAKLADVGNASGTISVTNAGRIAAGTSATTARHGIAASRAGGSGDVTVTNSGAVTASGDGISVMAAGAGGAVTVANSGNLGTATSKVARGIFVAHAGAPATGDAVSITHGAAIYSEGTGIAVDEYSGAGRVTVLVSAPASITTEQHGVSVSHSGSAGAVAITHRGAITSASTVSHRGIEAISTGKDSAGANHGVSVTMPQAQAGGSPGTISVPSGGVGIHAAVGAARQEADTDHADYVAPMNAGLAKVDVESGSIDAKGGAIQAFNYEAGSVQVDVASGVMLTSTQGHGIEARLADVGNASGTVSVTNAGTIKAGTMATSARHGIAASRAGGSGDVTVTNSGAIEASGDGIFAMAAGAGGDVTVANSGDLGTATARVARGIFAAHDGAPAAGDAGNVTVSHSGDLMAADYGVLARIGHAGNAGNIDVDVDAGSVHSRGDGVRAEYTTPHDGNGRIDVTIAAGVSVTGDRAGVHVANAGMGEVAEDSDWGEALFLGEDTMLRQQFVTVRGTVTGGMDAAVHLSGGGALLVSRGAKVHAASSRPAILVNDPGPSRIVIHGEVRGAEGAVAAVDVSGGGRVVVGLTGSVHANGAARAIRASKATREDTRTTTVVLHAPLDRQVDGGLSYEDARDAAARVQGGIGGTGLAANADGQEQVVFGLADGDGATGQVVRSLNDDGEPVLCGLPGAPACPPPPGNGSGGPGGGPGGPGDGSGGPGDGSGGGPGDGSGGPGDGSGGPGDGSGGGPGDGSGGPGDGSRGPGGGPGMPGTMTMMNCDAASDRRCRFYEALPSMLLAMNDLPTWAERMSAARDGKGAWAQVESAGGKWKAGSSTRPNVAYDHRRHGVRAGMDFAVGEAGRVGVSVHGLRGSAEMTRAGGEARLSGNGVGVNATTAIAADVYVDAQAAVTWYDVDLTSSSGRKLKDGVGGWGYALGVEAGHLMALSDDLSLTPRIGLARSRVSLDDFTDSRLTRDSRVSMGDAYSLAGRAGLMVETAFGAAPGRVFATVDVEHEFNDETSMNVAGAHLETSARSTGVRLGVGGEFGVGESVVLRARAGVATSGSATNEYGGRLELNLRF